VLHSHCRDNSGVYLCYMKGLVSVFLDAWLKLWVSLEHAFTSMFTTSRAEQCSSTAHLLARWGHKGLHPGGHVHKEVVHLLSPQPASITNLSAFKSECNGMPQF